MRIRDFVTIICIALTVNINAIAVNDTIIIRSDTSADIITANLDSLVNSWYVKMALADNPDLLSDDSNGIMFTDSVYKERLGRINTIIRLPYGSIIRNHIHVYTVKKRELFSSIMGLKDYYFPMIENIFDSYGIPVELKYMAIIESALNPNAVSRVGATGLWQFMYSTGRSYGLTVNSIVDERRD
ncbi:MAG TPA: transglycosylase SLT domain-containing protein, partial [Bacteroidales bacterium]|nr:transglycosylase SLT domain-containing protein [Bacteroidales bacterium]